MLFLAQPVHFSSVYNRCQKILYIQKLLPWLYQHSNSTVCHHIARKYNAESVNLAWYKIRQTLVPFSSSLNMASFPVSNTMTCFESNPCFAYKLDGDCFSLIDVALCQGIYILTGSNLFLPYLTLQEGVSRVIQ